MLLCMQSVWGEYYTSYLPWLSHSWLWQWLCLKQLLPTQHTLKNNHTANRTIQLFFLTMMASISSTDCRWVNSRRPWLKFQDYNLFVSGVVYLPLRMSLCKLLRCRLWCQRRSGSPTLADRCHPAPLWHSTCKSLRWRKVCMHLGSWNSQKWVNRNL